MNRFFNPAYRCLTPYKPGEQPRKSEWEKIIKLNTNESPFPPPESVVKAVSEAAGALRLYPAPESDELTRAIADDAGVDADEVIVTNGSDEALYFSFLAFCGAYTGAAFPDVTYGFYRVLAELCGVSYKEIPLRDDFTVDIADYIGIGRTVFLANPNAPTGLSLHRRTLERLIAGNPDNIVVIDEAYVDFGAESAVPLVKKYDNLIVTQTFSKSRSMAGARLGFAVANRELINCLKTVKNSTNPYNVNSMTAAAGLASLKSGDEVKKNCEYIVRTREYFKCELSRLGFEFTDSAANFVFARHPKLGGGALAEMLKSRGILVRHFDGARTRDYVRITVGRKEDMDTLIKNLAEITEAL